MEVEKSNLRESLDSVKPPSEKDVKPDIIALEKAWKAGALLNLTGKMESPIGEWLDFLADKIVGLEDGIRRLEKFVASGDGRIDGQRIKDEIRRELMKVGEY